MKPKPLLKSLYSQPIHSTCRKRSSQLGPFRSTRRSDGSLKTRRRGRPVGIRLNISFCAWRSANGDELHGATAEKMWAHVTEPFIQAITNGVHIPTWQDSIIARPQTIPMWTRHMELKQELLNEIEDSTVSPDPEPLLIGF